MGDRSLSKFHTDIGVSFILTKKALLPPQYRIREPIRCFFSFFQDKSFKSSKARNRSRFKGRLKSKPSGAWIMQISKMRNLLYIFLYTRNLRNAFVKSYPKAIIYLSGCCGITKEKAEMVYGHSPYGLKIPIIVMQILGVEMGEGNSSLS